MPATSKTAKKTVGNSGASTPPPAAGIRAEFPPPHYWRRWASDAPEPLFAKDGSDAVTTEILPKVLPEAIGDGREAPYRVLIVEDDRSQALFAESVLNGTGMQAQVVSVGSEVMAAMASFRPDLVLTDLHMPGMSGTEITRMIRADSGFAHTPIVFMTGDTDPERQLEVLSVGADDFLTKPVKPRYLIAAVESRVRRARMQQRQRSGDGRHPATGLYTRTAMLERLGSDVPGRTTGALYFVEIESTSALRDRHGYVALDKALVEAGRHLAMLVGTHPVSRLNDNAFLVFGGDIAPAEQSNWARMLRDGIGRHALTIGGDTVRLRALVGYAPLQHGFADASSALAAAEQALRDARALPIGIAAHTPATQSEAEAASDGANTIHDAMLHDRFELAYQPIVAVAGGDEAQYQTLLRMRDEDGTQRTAAAILPIAESAGLLLEIDRRAMQLAIAMLQRRKSEDRPVRLFVSQSARTLSADGHADWLLQQLAAADVEGSMLVVDVRQEDALINALQLQDFCARMVAAGVQLCLNQYHSGTEADALLAQLPLGFVRLSARYSSKLGDAPVRDEMRASIERAHRLGLQVIGQQVEDPQAAATLWMSGVDFIQGNLVQRAADALNFDFQHSVL